MPNPNCEKCKPDKPQDHPYLVEQTGCQKFYEEVDKCMKNYHGNIGDCKKEWKDFQKCMKKSGSD
jgi:hypothetical protein